ncbi:MAG TPA: signal recognition particle-docking protein FtsY [Candidatus Nanoarchaeia archaeon]|nr:signal recognition particle-docking protein FtsY [Candidatus Nanoarchaeia archaeon]
MFSFLKDKLKKAMGLFTKEVKEKSVEEEVEVEKPPVKEKLKSAPTPKKPVSKPKVEKSKVEKPRPEKSKPEKIAEEPKKKEIKIIVQEPKEETQSIVKEKPGFFGRLFGKKEEPIVEDKTEEKEEAREKAGFFTRLKEKVTKIQLSDDKFEEIFQPLEIALLESNVALEVVEKIKADLKQELMSDRIHRKQVDQIVHDTLKKSIEDLFNVEGIDLLKKAKEKKPYVIAFFGVNGSGKTTTIAKFANLFLKHKKTVVMAAADTFRAAAIQQLEEHANKLGVKIIKHDYESDPAAVAFDAIKHAQSKGIDIVLIDTAGRQHANKNLMQELEKVIRVNKPDLKVFIGESITGNDCIEQAKQFNEAVGIDVIVLTKADVDEKGGAAISISYVTGKPIIYLGMGQTYDDLVPFNKEKILESVGL